MRPHPYTKSERIDAALDMFFQNLSFSHQRTLSAFTRSQLYWRGVVRSWNVCFDWNEL